MQQVVEALEQNYHSIKKEFEAAPKEMLSNAGGPLFVPGWNVLALRSQNIDFWQVHKRCPVLSSIVLRFSDLITYCGFSVLNPDAIIYPHKGITNTVLRCHLGISIPEGDLALKVDGQILKWQEGKAFIFDDTLLHEAWNKTKQNRVIVLIDIKKQFDKF